MSNALEQSEVSLHEEKSAELVDQTWRECIGSCHAYLTLREDWRNHVRLIQSEISFRYIRFHNLLSDLMGVARLGSTGELICNWSLVDNAFDFLASAKLRPYIEIGFMPGCLASGRREVFAYRANVTLPKDISLWRQLIERLVNHLISRYGLMEVLSWPFEIWNEPDLHWFFEGSQTDYFIFYAETVSSIKSVHPSLKVGGPSTSRCRWIGDFVTWCFNNSVPIDFVSTHHYGADAALVIGDSNESVQWRGQISMRDDLIRCRSEINRSGGASLPLHITEWNVSPCHEDIHGKDSCFTATFALQTIRDTLGMCQIQSWWCISDIFEESGPGRGPLSGKYGIVTRDGIPKPVFHAFKFLSLMRGKEFNTGRQDVIADTDWRGDMQVLAWNFVEPTYVDTRGGEWTFPRIIKTLAFQLPTGTTKWVATVHEVGPGYGDVLTEWKKMGMPADPNPQQLQALKDAAQPRIRRIIVEGNQLRFPIELPENAFVYIHFQKSP